MNAHDIARLRLNTLQIAAQRFNQPAQVVDWLGAVQAQDYSGVKWSVGLRLPTATDADVERAIASGSIVRTWLLRGTLHLAPPADVRWMLALAGPRIIARSSTMHHNLGLDAATVARSEKVLIQELQGGRHRTRHEVIAALEREGIPATLSYFVLQRAGMAGLICFAPRRHGQQGFTLLDEWVPAAPAVEREDAVAKLARRYFQSHGPATLQDFVWWSGLSAREARAGVDRIGSEVASEAVDGLTYWMSPDVVPNHDFDGRAYLLPGFDEYLLGYRDRSAVLAPEDKVKVVTGSNGVFTPTVVVGGRVAGTWKATTSRGVTSIVTKPFSFFAEDQSRAIASASERYRQFAEESGTTPNSEDIGE
jgi:hypothetical protein